MKRALILLAILATLGVVGFMGASYLLLTHPIMTIGLGVIGVNVLVFSIFKIG